MRSLQGSRPFVLPMVLCFALGVLFSWAIIGLNLPRTAQLPTISAGELAAEAPAPASSPSAPAEGTSPRVGGGAVAMLGGFLGYRGFAALAATISVLVIILSVLSICAFVVRRHVRRMVLAVLALQVSLAALATLYWGSGMAQAAARLVCGGETGLATAVWNFCGSLRRPELKSLQLHTDFHTWINVICGAATVSVVFAIFIAASSREGRSTVFGTSEKAVTLLLVGASTLLVAVVLLDKGLLNWAFADYLASDQAFPGVVAHINGTSTFNGAVETALLAITWFVAILLLQQSGAERTAAADGPLQTAASNLSVYNISAICAPILSAVASNTLG